MRIYIASDHAGLELKSRLITELLDHHWLPDVKREVHDLGPLSSDSVDYPDYADLVARKVHGFSLIQDELAKSLPAELGILICGSGQGMAMRANKYAHIRAALCWSPQVAQLAREHNDANILCLGSRLLTPEQSLTILEAFLKTPFAGGRHARRVAKLSHPIS